MYYEKDSSSRIIHKRSLETSPTPFSEKLKLTISQDQ